MIGGIQFVFDVGNNTNLNIFVSLSLKILYFLLNFPIFPYINFILALLKATNFLEKEIVTAEGK